jgi:hypothetical protein
MVHKEVGCCCAWVVKQAEPFGFASIFGSLFCVKAKGGKQTLEELIKTVKQLQ